MKTQFFSSNLLLFLLWVASNALNAHAAGSGIKNFEKPKISRFQESGDFVWCSAKYLAVSKHSRDPDAGIRLLNIESGQVRKLTTNTRHRVVACTPDDKHIFFVENGIRGTVNEFDIDRGKQQVIYSNNLFQHGVIEDAPISPSGELLIGPRTLSERVTLSDRSLNGIHIPDDFLGKTVSGIAWSEDEAVFLVFNSELGDSKNNPQKLLTMKSGNLHPKVIDLPSIKDNQFRQAGWSSVARRLYLLAWDDAKLYELEPENPTQSLRLIAKDVLEFKTMPNGALVYLQIFGVTDSKRDDTSTIDKDAYRSLLLQTAKGEIAELLRVPYMSLGISGIQVSPGGEAIAVGITKIGGRNDVTEINILHVGSK